MPDLVPVRRALLSVSDKTGLVKIAKALDDLGIELVSTGGTRQSLLDAGLEVRDVGELTGFASMMDGRVKTLHPAVHGGLLALRDNEAHRAAMAAHDIAPIDLLYVNLYPFEETVAGGGSFDECIENIDIGGPAMLRAAAKNYAWVCTCTDTDDMARVLEALRANDGATPLTLRKALSANTYARTAAYDAAIANWYAAQIGETSPTYRVIGGRRRQDLRYGENPHQSAAFYHAGPARPGVTSARQIQGKALSYNNINDTDAAFELVSAFNGQDTAAVAIIKHANPCGVACADNVRSAYERALRCDPVSAFGGIVALNRPLDEAMAARICETFTEVVIAPDADAGAKAVFAKKPNLRLLLSGEMADPLQAGLSARSVSGGLLVQDLDVGHITQNDLRIVTKRAPDAREMADLLFAWRVGKFVKSNTIIYARNLASVGIGAGQMSRVDAARIAAIKANDATKAAGLDTPLTQGCVAASDAFFPFADGLLQAAEAGARAIIQPGGSMRDDEVIAAADAAGLAMVFTGMRHFRH